MSDNGPELIRRVPGRLCAAPTDLTIDFPHGGTALGNCRGIDFVPGFKAAYATAEEYGGRRIAATYVGPGAVLGAVVRDYDRDAMLKLFPGAAVGAAGGVAIADEAKTQATRAGALLEGRGFVLYFSPDAIDQDPGLLVYAAVPLVAETMRLRFAWSEEWGFPALFQAMPDANAAARLWKIGVRGDLAL